MIIGFDAKRAFLNKSGLGNYSRDVIRTLTDFFPEHSYLLFSPLNSTQLLEKKYLKNTISPNLEFPILKTLWRSFLLGNTIDKYKPHIYHGLSNELPFDINKAKTKKVVTIHDLIFLRFPSLYSFTDRKIYFQKFQFACKNADKIIATSIQTKNDIIHYLKIPESKIEVVYQSCNPAFNQKLSISDINLIRKKHKLPDKFILSVGTIEKRKNALSAVKALKQLNSDINLVLAGRKTPYCNEIADYANSNGLGSRIFIRDNITNDDLPALYQMADAFVYISVFEGFGIPILEAFQSGLPLICSNLGSMAEIAGNAALLVDPLCVNEISDAIQLVLENKNIKDNLVVYGIERSKLFERELIGRKIFDIYEQLM